MNNRDKPFPCSIGSCKQRFANADHLTVHCMKHEMSLKSLDTPVINDTTPTPTRFLKDHNAGEDGLFTDLVPPTNPFDMEFKKASEKRRMSQEAVPAIMPLETPETRVGDSDSGRGSEPIPESVSEGSIGDIISESPASPAHPVPTHQQAPVVSDQIPRVNVEEVTDDDLQVVDAPPAAVPVVTVPSDDTANFAADHPKTLTTLQTRPQSRLVTTTQAAAALAPTQMLSDQTLQAHANSLHSIVNSLPTNITAPLLIKLPGGQQIRVVPSVVANPSAPVPVAISANQKTTKQVLPKTASQAVIAAATRGQDVKERLKETLLSNQSHGNMNVMAKAAEVRRQEQLHGSMKQENVSYTVVAGTEELEHEPELLTGMKRSSDDDEPEQKRQKFLQRNRAAAMRCREKKKMWVSNLETKAENLTVVNVKLNNEILKLKNEVAHLKQLLLAHKDCPVTMRQQQQTQNWQVFHSIKETEEDMRSAKVSVETLPGEHPHGQMMMDTNAVVPGGVSVIQELSQTMQDAVTELSSQIGDREVTSITMEEGQEVPTVIIN